MEFVRQVIDSNALDKIFLPQNLKNRKVEIIILPVDEKEHLQKQVKKEKSIDEFVGMLAKYKNPKLIHLEKSAWAQAMVDKYGTN